MPPLRVEDIAGLDPGFEGPGCEKETVQSQLIKESRLRIDLRDEISQSLQPILARVALLEAQLQANEVALAAFQNLELIAIAWLHLW